MSWLGTAIGWPFAFLGIVVLLAVPIQSLFKTIQTWAMTPEGKTFTKAALAKVGEMLPSIGGIPGTTTILKKEESSVTTPAAPTDDPPSHAG